MTRCPECNGERDDDRLRFCARCRRVDLALAAGAASTVTIKVRP